MRPELIDAVTEMGWLLPRDVQDEAIPLILGGADVMIASETGSGKTGALALPILQLIYEHLRGEASTDVKAEPSADGLKAQDEARARNRAHFRLSSSVRGESVALDETGLRAQSRQKGWFGARSRVGVSGRALGPAAATPGSKKEKPSHRWYFEVTAEDDGMVRLGVALAEAGNNLGTDGHSWGFGSAGKKSHRR